MSSISSMSSKSFYAVANGRTKGVFLTWAECDKSVKDFPGAKFKKFTSQQDAETFVNTKPNSNFNSNSNSNSAKSKYSDVNFDSDSDTDTDTNPKPNPKPKPKLISNSKKTWTTKSEEDAIRSNINFDSSDSETETKKVSTHIKTPLQTQTKLSDYPTELGDFVPDIIVYTDGACLSNGKPNAKAGIGVYFGPSDPRNISTLVQGKQSNNTAELNALIEAYKVVSHDISQGKKVAFFTDSVYSLWCLTTYGAKCAQTKWTKVIPNKELVQQAYELFGSNSNPNIKLIHVCSHTGAQDAHSLGNEQADQLANLSIGMGMGVGVDTKKFVKVETLGKKVYLKIAFEKKELAKKLGCKWDPDKKSWYCEESNGKALEQFKASI